VFGPILSGTQEIRKVLFGSSFPDFLISRFKPSFPAEVMFVHEHLKLQAREDSRSRRARASFIPFALFLNIDNIPP
jgi:hypothetical protein